MSDENMIYTARYQSKLINNAKHYPVRTTLGAPRFRLPYELEAVIDEIKPPRHLFGVDFDEFHKGYYAHLDGLGLAKVNRILSQHVKAAGGRKVLLLCFCGPDKEFCHRHVFAAWYYERTGHAIKELG